MAKHSHRIYDLTIETLSPLHIGSGQALRNGFDFVVHDGSTWVIDNSRLAEEIYDADKEDLWQELLLGRPAAELLGREDFYAENPIFRYVLQDVPDSSRTGNELHELLKTPWHHPYLPGSSLKGALRTAFLVEAFGRLGMQVDPSRLSGNARRVGQPLEQAITAPGIQRNQAPNHDILKAFQVSDSAPGEDMKLIVINAAVYGGGKGTIPIVLECIPAQASLSSRLTLDTALLDQYGPAQLGWEPKQQVRWLKGIRVCANNLSKRRVRQEYQYWTTRSPRMEGFYMRLFKEIDEADRNTFFLQVGWGGGWSSKTFGHHLTQNEAAFAGLVNSYREMKGRGSFEAGDPFPKSRRIATNDGEPSTPFGWLRVKMERIQ